MSTQEPTSWPQRHATVWLDTEFNGWGGELISLALVDDHDRQFYEAVRCDNPLPWVAENVMPVLHTRARTLKWLQQHLHWWLSAYDSVHIVADWPDDVAYFCRALITGPGERINTPALTFEIRRDLDAVSAVPHNALEDAKAMRARHLQMMASGPRRVAAWPAEGTSHNAPAARASDQSARPSPPDWPDPTGDEFKRLFLHAEPAASDAGSAGVVSASGASSAAAARPRKPGGGTL